jgi:hypothetical protein
MCKSQSYNADVEAQVYMMDRLHYDYLGRASYKPYYRQKGEEARKIIEQCPETKEEASVGCSLIETGGRFNVSCR